MALSDYLKSMSHEDRKRTTRGWKPPGQVGVGRDKKRQKEQNKSCFKYPRINYFFCRVIKTNEKTKVIPREVKITTNSCRSSTEDGNKM